MDKKKLSIRSKEKVFRKELLFQSVLRHAEYYSNVKGASKIIGIYWKILFKIMSSRHNVMIPLNVFGKGLLIAHLQNIVVSSNWTKLLFISWNNYWNIIRKR